MGFYKSSVVSLLIYSFELSTYFALMDLNAVRLTSVIIRYFLGVGGGGGEGTDGGLPGVFG